MLEAAAFPDDPPLVRLWRGAHVESQHRGAWVLVDAAGDVLDGAGDFEAPHYMRSAVKALQALPLLETGAAERFAVSNAELALCLASHNAEPCHTDAVLGLLGRLGLSVADLRCGPQEPGDPDARRDLALRGEAPSALHNNCSGKHAGFLALALHLGVPAERYLDPESEGQRLVRAAVLETTGTGPEDVALGVDGCSAPTFRLPLSGLARAFARIANPGGLPPARRASCERMTAAVAAHPHLVAGRSGRLCTALAGLAGGRLFPKVGAEAVYAVGVRGADRALAVKVDDGAYRAMHALVVDLLARFELISAAERDALGAWADRTLRNRAGLDVGRVEVLA